MKVASGRKAAGAIRSLVNGRGLQLECARVLHVRLLMPVLLYDSETMKWSKKGKSKIRAVQMDNLRGLLGIEEWIEYQMHRLECYTEYQKGLMKVFSGGVAILKKWIMIRLLKGCM